MDKIFWRNVPDLLEYNVRFDSKQYCHDESIVCLSDETPYIVYFYNQKINFLENLKHSKKGIEKLNNKGLHIFLYEPLCQLANNDTREKNFYSYLPHGFKEHDVVVLELESIKHYVVKNKLTNVTVHTGDYNVNIYYKKYSQYMNLICDDIFLRYVSINTANVSVSENFNKKFISLNWRLEPHRMLIVLYLINKNSHLSWYFDFNQQFLENFLWFDFNLYKRKYPKVYNRLVGNIDYLRSVVPLCLDVKIEKPTKPSRRNGNHNYWPIERYKKHAENPVAKNRTIDEIKNFYDDVFCDVITESRFAQPTGNYSEKTYQAIKYKTPFILVAPYKTLEYIKSHGFKTFSKYWDETYDDYADHEDRMIKIFNLIDYLDTFSIDELKFLKKDMTDILDWNFDVLCSRTRFNVKK